jgi:hypothetical protein
MLKPDPVLMSYSATLQTALDRRGRLASARRVSAKCAPSYEGFGGFGLVPPHGPSLSPPGPSLHEGIVSRLLFVNHLLHFPIFVPSPYVVHFHQPARSYHLLRQWLDSRSGPPIAPATVFRIATPQLASSTQSLITRSSHHCADSR